MGPVLLLVFKRGGVDKSMRNAQTELFRKLQGYDSALVPQYDAFVYDIHITPSTLVVCLLNLSSQAKTSRPRPACRKFERHSEEGSHLIVIIRIKFDKKIITHSVQNTAPFESCERVQVLRAPSASVPAARC